MQFGFVNVPEPQFKRKDKMSQNRSWWVSGLEP